MINPTEAAKLIKKELKQTFPEKKFSVKTERYALGNCVNIFCDQELRSQVEKLTEKFSYYKGGNKFVHDDTLPQAKFINVLRSRPC